MPGTPMPGTPISAHLNIPVLRIQAPGILTAPPAPMFRRSDIPALRRFHAYRISDSVVECHQSALAICQPAVAGADFSQKTSFFRQISGENRLTGSRIFSFRVTASGKQRGVTEIGRQSSGSKHRTAEFGWQTSGDRQSGDRHQIAEITSAGRFPPRGCTKAYVPPCDIAVRCTWFSAAAHGDMYRFAVKLFRPRGRLLSSPSPRPWKTGGQPFLSVPGNLQAPDRKQATPSRLPKRP